ncbi:MAG: hypothetical protein LBN92_01620 [Treponema sp.]|jgi:hypothetical protein|nr:hypothetical protein [Treponema sp.]
MKAAACLLIPLACALLAGGCSRDSGAADHSNAAAAESADISSIAADGRRLVLEQGNVWTTGIPGFGANAIPALEGTYSAEAGRSFRAWLTREMLYFDNAWTPWPDLVETRRREASGGTLAARPLNGLWTVVFFFGGDFTTEEQAEIMRACGPRFTRYVSLSNRPSDASFPAIIEY